MRVKEKVEAPHFIGAVVRAVTRADAAVINHLVETLGAMHGCCHRAYQLAESIFTMHARNRLEIYFRILNWTLEVAIHAQPVHVASLGDLLFPDYGNVVFRLARDGARMAPGARVE